jgi:ABC-type uncharacterized transport system ATPase subunit
MEQLIIPKDIHQLLKILHYFAVEHKEKDMQHIIYLVQKLAEQEKSTSDVTVINQGKLLKSRWAKFSEEIKKEPPLRGLGDYVRQCSKEFREDFALNHDEA